MIRRGEQDLAVAFQDSDAIRRAMIVELFTGRYNNDVARIVPLNVFSRLLRTLLTA